MTTELIQALFTGLVALIGAVNIFLVARERWKRDEVRLLREEVARLQKRLASLEDLVDRQRERICELERENFWLKHILTTKGIDIPPLPKEPC